jgi:hypothetical protein
MRPVFALALCFERVFIFVSTVAAMYVENVFSGVETGVAHDLGLALTGVLNRQPRSGSQEPPHHSRCWKSGDERPLQKVAVRKYRYSFRAGRSWSDGECAIQLPVEF